MITIGMNYEVLEGKGEQFEAMFTKVLQVMGETPGHTRSHLYRDVNNANSYLILSEWSDRGAFDQFVASDRFKGVANWGREQILATRPRHEVYEAGGSAAPRGGGECPVQH